MGRVRTEDGKRVSIGLKVSEAKAKAVDAARGETPRALWLEALVDAALGDGPASAAATEGREIPPVRARTHTPPKRSSEALEAAPDRVEEVRTLAEATGAPLVRASELDPPAPRPKGKCGHSSMRIRKGICPDCGEWVTGKS